MIRPLRMVWLGLTIVWFGFVLSPASMNAAEGAPVKVSAPEAAKLLISSPAPDPNPMWKAGRMEGMVRFEFTVTEDGAVTDIKVLSSKGLDDYVANPAKDALSHWKYHPYTVNGKPTPMRTSVEYVLGPPSYLLRPVSKSGALP